MIIVMEVNKVSEIDIKKLVAVNVPLVACNLRCHYCYLSQLKNWDTPKTRVYYDVEKIKKAFSVERLGGISLINLTGMGETLLPEEMPKVIRALLENGHYLEVVTNGTLTKRFDEISKFPKELLERIEFKFSFHYLELLRLNILDQFFENVILMRDKGCSFTIELMPTDELIPYIDEIKTICMQKVGALCQLTLGRDDTDNRKLLTKMSPDEYVKTWETFDSEMFKFKYSVYNQKRTEYCYAGKWSLYVNLATGDVSRCYGCHPDQNIYDNIEKPLIFREVGHGCKNPFCFNAHAFMTLGLIPSIQTPTYADMRDRVTVDGQHWFSQKVTKAFSTKLYETNSGQSMLSRFIYYVSYPSYIVRELSYNRKKITSHIKGKIVRERN